jgi:hypothetical protein
LASCDECCAYRELIVGYRGILSATSLEPWMLIPYCSWSLKCRDWCIRNIGVRRANLLTLEDLYWLLLSRLVAISPISADQHKQIKLVSRKEHGQYKRESILQYETKWAPCVITGWKELFLLVFSVLLKVFNKM